MLYTTTFSKTKTFKEIWDEGVENIQFRRTLVGDLGDQWHRLLDLLSEVVLSNDEDSIIWRLNGGKFTVKFLYLLLRATGVLHYKSLWKLKIPLKIMIFLWLLLKNSIFTKDNLIKRGCTGNELCHFYSGKETMDHLCFLALLPDLSGMWSIVHWS